MKSRVVAYFAAINLLSVAFVVLHYRGIIGKSLLPELSSRSDLLHTVGATNAESKESMRSPVVLIQTNYRSGSSFFGELFNQRKDVYYSYEPLAVANSTNTLQVLNSTFSCNIQDVSRLTVLEYDSGTGKECLRHNVCFRKRMKNLCGEQFCLRPRSCMGCRRLSSREMSELCQAKQLIVTKVIRLPLLESIEPLMKDERFNLKVIHLVRDPRGIMSSRIKLSKTSSMKSTCRNMQENVELGLLNTPEWLQGRYKLIRYEDLSLHPEAVANEVYDFLGLEMTTEMQRWININTMGLTKLSSDPIAQRIWNSVSRKRKRVSQEKVNQMIVSYAYTTIRNSTTTWNSWVDTLKRSTVQAIQDDCREIMEMLGYGLVTTSDKTSNDKILKVLPPMQKKSGLTHPPNLDGIH